jgi:hypothetical protein
VLERAPSTRSPTARAAALEGDRVLIANKVDLTDPESRS